MNWQYWGILQRQDFTSGIQTLHQSQPKVREVVLVDRMQLEAKVEVELKREKERLTEDCLGYIIQNIHKRIWPKE